MIRKPKNVAQLPKVSPNMKGYTSCIISDCHIGQDPNETNIDLSQEVVHKLLKQKIENMISQKMRVMSRRK